MGTKTQFEDDEPIAFFKTVTKSESAPVLDSTQKVVLNRKGNILYNSGDIEGARRIFLTTGYSDGLTRIGDYYKSQGKEMDALRMYWIAPDRTKANAIIMRLSAVVQNLIHDEENKNE
ncbi:hypothetical protein FACS1894172_09810 [Spirochaetia bacterium]|nr:hypothetical protein FACS1894164_08290 [Spirochaetia bacterium]GHU32710.1 hypothetical protein FACS1894172_09810 [Spirochaetia bacterium]